MGQKNYWNSVSETKTFTGGMIERGRKEFPYLDLQVKKDADIAFPDDTFDAVILFAVLTCIIRDEEQEALIQWLLLYRP